MLDATSRWRRSLKPKRLIADTAYGTGKFLGWLVGTGITPHIPVKEMSRDDGTFSSSDFTFDRERNVYVCPTNQLLNTTGNVGGDHKVRIVHRGATAAHVHSSRNAVQPRPRARSRATSMRMPRSCMHLRGYAGVRTIARRAQEGRDAICVSEDPPSFRAHAPAGPLRRARRVPPRSIVQNLKTLAKHIWRPML